MEVEVSKEYKEVKEEEFYGSEPERLRVGKFVL